MRLTLSITAAVLLLRGSASAENVTLPAPTTDAGILARLLLAECRTPAHAKYDAAQVLSSMKAMKAVIDNRLHNDPKQFGAPGAKTYRDIIGAPGQFHGFSKNTAGTIVIASDVQARIDEILKKANTGPPGKFAQFVQNALDVANGPISDPFKGLTTIGGVAVTGGGYGWRTAGSAHPGGRFVAITETQGGVIAGNQFYTLKED